MFSVFCSPSFANDPVSSMYTWLVGWKSGLPLPFLVTFRLKLAPHLGAVSEQKMDVKNG